MKFLFRKSKNQNCWSFEIVSFEIGRKLLPNVFKSNKNVQKIVVRIAVSSNDGTPAIQKFNIIFEIRGDKMCANICFEA